MVRVEFSRARAVDRELPQDLAHLKLYTHSMVTTLTCHSMCHCDLIRQEVFVDANGRPSCILIARNKGAKELKSGRQNLKGLEEFVFPMNFLETQDIVGAQELLEVIVFTFPVSLRGKD